MKNTGKQITMHEDDVRELIRSVDRIYVAATKNALDKSFELAIQIVKDHGDNVAGMLGALDGVRRLGAALPPPVLDPTLLEALTMTIMREGTVYPITPGQPCCERDYDRDGNCDRHPAKTGRPD